MSAGAEENVDVIVVGSGAGALLTAVRASSLGAKVLVLEKTSKFGGTSAMSGGGIWVPNNPYAAAIGVQDSEAEAFDYMRTVIPKDQVNDATIHCYIANSQKMIRYLESVGVKYRAVPGYADYYPSVKGWKGGGRTLDCTPFDGTELGEELYNLRELPPSNVIFGLANMSVLDSVRIFAQVPGWMNIVAGIVVRYMLDIPARLKSSRDRRLTMGNALVGGLYAQAKRNGVRILLNTPVVDLIHENGRVQGVICGAANGGQRRYKAARGVVLASGGFEKNPTLREKYLPNPTSTDWTVGSEGNTGDLIAPVVGVGAKLGLMHEAWWAPTVKGATGPIALFFEKSKPNMMIVDRHGRRFMNESITYNSYGQEMYRREKEGEAAGVPAFVIFDANYRAKYPFAGLIQGQFMPDWLTPATFKPGGTLKKANSLPELAAVLGIDPAGLRATAAEMAEMAKTGIDSKFGRGSDMHDKMYGDQEVGPNPCLGPLSKPPFYGAPLLAGDIGTKGGFVIDNSARVLDQNDAPIAGLYAAGNCTASIMGDKYPGAGCTLGPALTMGYIAAGHIMGVNDAA